MKVKSERDFAAALLFLLLAIGFAVGALDRWFGSAALPGPGYFPLLLSILLALLGLVLLFKSLAIEAAGGEPLGAIAWRPLLAVVGALLVFGAALPRLGLVPAAMLLGAIAAAAVPGCRWRDLLLGAVLPGLACWLVFGVGWPQWQPLPLLRWPPVLPGLLA